MTQEERMTKALIQALELAERASEWGMDEVEIDGEMTTTRDLRRGFEAVLNGYDITGMAGPMGY